jgi:hypothetical protein
MSTFDFNNSDPNMLAMFQQFIAMMQTNGGQMPTFPAAPAIVPQVPCPLVKDITLFQATLLDNGAKGERKKYEPRYKICVEVWTDDGDDIKLSEWQWKRNVVLIEGTVFKKRIDKLLAGGSITPAFHERLKDIWSKFDTHETLFGILGDKGSRDPNGKKGTNYYDGQFVVVAMDTNRKPKVMFFMTDDPAQQDSGGLSIDQFEGTDMKGQPLKGKYKWQARVDRCDWSENWATQEGNGDL